MGWLKIKPKHVKLATDDSLFNRDVLINPKSGRKRNAKEIIHWCETEARRLGVKIIKKPKSSLKLSKFGTTYYGEIRLPMNYDGRPGWRNAALWVHELIHVWQWRHYKRFGFKYIFSARWRWAIEMQCYRATIRVWKHFGKNTVQYIANKPEDMRDSYACRSIKWKHLRENTITILQDAYDSWRA